MSLHWDVFAAAKITDLTKARELRSTLGYEIIAIKGAWYMRDKYLIIDTLYPGSSLVENGTIEYSTPAGAKREKFDQERLANFENLASTNEWEIQFWETFRSGNGSPRYRLVKIEYV